MSALAGRAVELPWSACLLLLALGACSNSTEPSDAHVALMEAIAPLVAGGEVPDWIPFDGWAVKGGEVSTYYRWNSPTPETGVIPALDFERENHAVRVLAYYAAQLAAHDIELLVVPVPSRIQVYPDRIPGVPKVPEPFEGTGAGYKRVLLELAEAGVEVIDLLPALARERYDHSGADDELVFLDYDHHWTPRGAEIAAKAIAARLNALPGLARGPARAGVEFEVRQELGPWKAMQLERADKRFVPVTNHAIPQIDEPVDVWFRRVVTPAGEPVSVEDRASPILFLADSFGGYYEGADSDVKRLIFAETGSKLDAIVLLGAGGRSAWKAVARRGDDLAGKQVVVWLFTARSLANANLKTVPVFRD